MPPLLEVLNMDEAGEFTGGIPSEWGSLTNLKSLDMRYCGLDGASSGYDQQTYRKNS